MGTRATITIKDGRSILCKVYRQFDGYPMGLGQDIKDILGQTTITNGFGSSQKLPSFASGIGCAAAYLIEKLKESKIGNVYLQPITQTWGWIEYDYTLWVDKNSRLMLTVTTNKGKTTLYRGTLVDFDSKQTELKERA